MQRNSDIGNSDLKKNIIIGFHNSYVIFENYKLILNISKIANIYLFTTDHYLSKKKKLIIQNLKKKKIIKDYIIFNRYFLNTNNLNPFKIILNYFLIFQKLKKISKKKIHICILGSNVFMWERIITEKIIDKHSKLIIYQQDMLTLPIVTIEELYKNISIEKILSKIHKSRQLKKNTNKLINKKVNFMGVLNNKIDFFERIVLGKFFFKKKFEYRDIDFNVWMDHKNTRIDTIFTFFPTLKLYWKKIYPKVKVKLIVKENSCKCKKELNKKKLLLLGDDFRYQKQVQKKIFLDLKRDLQLIISKIKKEVFVIDFKPHPASSHIENLEYMKFLSKEFNDLKVNLLKKEIVLENIACNYLIATGPIGTGLYKIHQACNYCFVIGLASQSKHYHILSGEDGEKSWLKLKNTKIGYIKDDGSFSKNAFDLNNKNNKLKTFLNELAKDLK